MIDESVLHLPVSELAVRLKARQLSPIELTRAYTDVASILNQQSDMRRNAIERLAEVPA